ncbi:MAG TPA: hypothetical protein PKB02_13185 [Anaerohalosphaeraceae bacterium]|nr:hypothetical protein [Anaerohalosphaeraceae bacterium]
MKYYKTQTPIALYLCLMIFASHSGCSKDEPSQKNEEVMENDTAIRNVSESWGGFPQDKHYFFINKYQELADEQEAYRLVPATFNAVTDLDNWKIVGTKKLIEEIDLRPKPCAIVVNYYLDAEYPNGTGGKLRELLENEVEQLRKELILQNIQQVEIVRIKIEDN